MPRHLTAMAVALCTALVLPWAIRAHEVPNEVTIQVFLKAEQSRLRVVARVPLIAMQDVTWPYKENGVLDQSRADRVLSDAAMLWLGQESAMYEEGRELPPPEVRAVRASPRSNQSFESYAEAVALVTGPREPDETLITIKEGFLDVLFDYPVQSAASRFSFEPLWGGLGLRAYTVVHLVLPEGGIRTFQLEGNPGIVHLDPSWTQVTRYFLDLGLRHLASGADYLLFLVALILPVRSRRDLVTTAVALAAAQGLTLFAGVFGFTPDVLWFQPFIETLVAGSILYLVVENILGANLRRRWIMAGVFGLVYGFSVSFALTRTLQFSGTHTVAAVGAFNLGVDLAEWMIVGIGAIAIGGLFRFVVPARLGGIVASAMIGHSAWHELTMRGTLLQAYSYVWPALTPAFFAGVVRWIMLFVATAGLLWLISVLARPGSQENIQPEA